MCERIVELPQYGMIVYDRSRTWDRICGCRSCIPWTCPAFSFDRTEIAAVVMIQEEPPRIVPDIIAKKTSSRRRVSR